MDFTTYASPGWFGLWGIICTLVGYVEEHTVKQDLLIWEHKSDLQPKALVRGDGPGFNNYKSWLTQFYSKSSSKQQTLDW